MKGNVQACVTRCDKSEAKACGVLAGMHVEGDGVPKDEGKAPYYVWDRNNTYFRNLEQAYNSVGEAFVRELLANPYQQSLEALTTAWRDLWGDVQKVADDA